jgi:hypothetical protein
VEVGREHKAEMALQNRWQSLIRESLHGQNHKHKNDDRAKTVRDRGKRRTNNIFAIRHFINWDLARSDYWAGLGATGTFFSPFSSAAVC